MDYVKLDKIIRQYENKNGILPGLVNLQSRDCFIKQLLDSIKRVKYISVIQSRVIDKTCINPKSISFNPLKAAIWFQRNHKMGEAIWLVFLSTVCGHNRKTKWKLCTNLYGSITKKTIWTWKKINADPNSYLKWVASNNSLIRRNAKFGNHRKYESLKPVKNGTIDCIRSYINWISPSRNQENFYDQFCLINGYNSKKTFNSLYKAMHPVVRFGRMAKFDFLSMLGKLKLVDIEPDSLYISQSTGPKQACKILFGSKISTSKGYELELSSLESMIGLKFGMQIIEDALCNWQKSQFKYQKFIS